MESICLVGLVGIVAVAAAVGAIISGLKKSSNSSCCNHSHPGPSQGCSDAGIDDKKEKQINDLTK